nr:hypothetical protein [Tanacetum cinerariifolium]
MVFILFMEVFNHGNAFALTVRKCTSSGITITSSGNVLEHFILNNPPLNLTLHLQSRDFARDCKAKGTKDSRRSDVGYNGNKTKDNGRRPAYQDDSKDLVTIDGEDINWSGYVEEDARNYAMMAYSSSNSGSENLGKSCSKACEESYARLKKLYDDQRDKLGDASVEITAYTLALKKIEAQLLCHQQNQLPYEQKIRFMKIDLDDKIDVLAYHKKLLGEDYKKKDDLKTKFENWQNSSKNLSKLLNTQMSANHKFGLGYGDYRYGSILSYENKASDLEYAPINDRFADGMHAVLPPMTGNYVPSGPDVEIDYSKFTYGPKQTSADELDSKPSEYASCKSKSSVKTSTSMLEQVENASKVFCEPKVWIDAHVIEEYESNSDNDSVSNVQEEKEKPSFSFIDSVKHDYPHRALKDKVIVDSRCSSHMTGNKAYLVDYKEFKGGFVTFGGFLAGYSINSKAFRVYNLETKRVEENLHVNFLENKPNVSGKGHAWMFDLDYLTNSINYEHVLVENQANKSAGPKEANNSAGTQVNDDQGANSEEINLNEEHFVLPIWSAYSANVKSS